MQKKCHTFEHADVYNDSHKQHELMQHVNASEPAFLPHEPVFLVDTSKNKVQDSL
jgi:hypothetical protein